MAQDPAQRAGSAPRTLQGLLPQIVGLTLAALWFGHFFYAAAQEPEWSHGRLVADEPLICSVVRAPKAPDGTVSGPPQRVAYIGAQDADRVQDYVIEPDYSYVTACGFFVRDPTIYWATAYMPMLLRRR